jgi:hypothetical protein
VAVLDIDGAMREVPVRDSVVGGALDGLNRGFGDEADEVGDHAVWVGGGFVVREEIDEAEIGVADAKEEDLSCVVWSA